MLTIGLTGGIGTGKSTVAAYFAELDIEIIDADAIAREVVSSDSAALDAIVDRFGDEMLDAQGELDRKQLRDLVFQHPDEREWLEALLHPIILKVMAERIKQVKSDYCVLAIPLLLESKASQKLVDRILVVDATDQQQRDRATTRDDMTAEQANAIIDSQASREERLAMADDVIDNRGDLEALKREVQSLHEKYMQAHT